LRLIVVNFFYINTEILEYLIQSFSIVSKSNSSVMRVILFYQNMTVETSHLRNSKDTDAAKALCCHRKNFTMSNVSPKLAVRSALKTVEGNVTWNNISFQSSLCNFFRKISCHDHLIFHSAGSQFSGSCISAVESHKGIFQCIVIFTFDLAVIDRCRNRIVNIQKC